MTTTATQNQFLSSGRKYVLTIDDGITVHHASAPMVQCTHIENGKVTVTETPYTEMFNVSSAPSVLMADWEGNGKWSVDHEAGFMRWYGTKTTRELFGALRRLGFGEIEIDAVRKLQVKK